MLMKRKEHTEKEKELLEKITAEYELFRCKMLLQPTWEIYNSCRSICFYGCLYCEKISRDFINASEKEHWVLAQLWELYLKNEYLKADTWDEIESILRTYVDMRMPQSEDGDTYSCMDNPHSVKEKTEKGSGSPVLKAD